MRALMLFLMWMLMIGFLAFLVTWLFVSNSHYSWLLLKPGMAYSIHDRRYKFPNLESVGPTYLLKTSHIAELRTLLDNTSRLLNSLNIEWFLTGGSLIGAERHKAIPMPFDDDIDMAVDFKHREQLFSAPFGQEAKKYQLQVIYLVGASTKSADRTGACVRLQLLNKHATLDIFFWYTDQQTNMVHKLDGWSGTSLVYNEKERFKYEDVYPIQKNVPLDDMLVNLPQNPRNLLIQQYTAGVFKKVIARSTAVSHLFPFLVLRKMWTQQAPN